MNWRAKAVQPEADGGLHPWRGARPSDEHGFLTTWSLAPTPSARQLTGPVSRERMTQLRACLRGLAGGGCFWSRPGSVDT